jgi:4-amino-4-deoxy-L-arabinose transferase-like glycosyltransferase
MAETNDWITPRLWGTPWFEKPVLYYWTGGLAMRLFGVSEIAARLPSALAALLAAAAIKWTALRTYGLGTAWYSLLMLPTSVAMIGFSRAAGPDMLFAALLTAAMAVACEMLQKLQPGPILRVAFGFFLGAAVLAKGPAAVILAGGATLLWAAMTGNWRAPFRFLHPLIIAVFCATALPWYVLCALRNPDFLRVFIWQHNFERYFTPIFEHPQPFWFFGLIFLLGILPWLPLLISGSYDVARNCDFRNYTNSPALFLICWTVFTLLFFSFSQSKLPGYILPAIPPGVLLIARGFVRQIERKSTGLSVALCGVAIVMPLLLGIACVNPGFAYKGGISYSPDPFRGVRVALAVAMIGCGISVALAVWRKWNGAICSAATTTVVLILIANRLVMPGLDDFISARPAAEGVRIIYNVKPDEIAVYHLPRAYQYGLNYYFGKDLPAWSPENTRASLIFFGADSLDELAHFYHFNIPPSPYPSPATLDEKILYLKIVPRSGQ